MTATLEKRAYPYIPQQTWKDLRRRFVQALPTRVTKDYLQSVLEVEESQARQHIGLLKVLGLIDEEESPTDLAQDWRSDDHYAEACRKMVERVYPKELLEAFSDAEPNREAVEKWFMRNTRVGQNAAYKRSLMFSLLLHADPNSPEPAPKARAPKPEQQRQRPVQPTPTQPAREGELSGTVSAASALQVLSPAVVATQNGSPALHIDIQIHIAADAQPEQIDPIFASMAKHLYNRS